MDQDKKPAAPDTSPGEGSDLIDYQGHTAAGAVRHDPSLDLSLPAASQVEPTGDQQVRAQTPEEVDAQLNGPKDQPEGLPNAPEDIDGGPTKA